MDANTNESIFGNSICIGDPALRVYGGQDGLSVPLVQTDFARLCGA